MAMLTFNFNGSFDKQSFEEQLMTRWTTIFGDTIRHRLPLHDSAEEDLRKGMRNKPHFLVIHNI